MSECCNEMLQKIKRMIVERCKFHYERKEYARRITLALLYDDIVTEFECELVTSNNPQQASK